MQIDFKTNPFLSLLNLSPVVKEERGRFNFSFLLVASQSLILILFSVSLLTMTAISIDRLLSLLLGIRYRQIVTLKRAVLIVVALWVMSLAGASSVFFRYSQISVWYGHILIALCLVTSTFSYAKIYQTLHQHRTQIQHQVHRDHLANRAISPLNMARYKKSVSTAMWIQLILAVCYIPQAIGTVFLTQKGLTSPVYTALQYGQTLIFLNSSLNPFFYFWKIGKVRKAVKNIVNQLAVQFVNLYRLELFINVLTLQVKTGLNLSINSRHILTSNFEGKTSGIK